MAEKGKVKIRMSAVKTHRKSEEARVINKSRRNAVATVEKKLRAAVASGDQTKAEEILKEEYSMLDKAAKLGSFHKNKASRKKSRIGSLVADMKKVAAPEAPAQA